MKFVTGGLNKSVPVETKFLIVCYCILWAFYLCWFAETNAIVDYAVEAGSDERTLVTRGLAMFEGGFQYINLKDFFIGGLVSLLGPTADIKLFFFVKAAIYGAAIYSFLQALYQHCVRNKFAARRTLRYATFLSAAYCFFNPLVLDFIHSALRDDVIIAGIALVLASELKTENHMKFAVAGGLLLLITRPQIFFVYVLLQALAADKGLKIKLLAIGLLILTISFFNLTHWPTRFEAITEYSPFNYVTSFRLAFFSPSPASIGALISGELISDASPAPFWLLIAFFCNLASLALFSLILIAKKRRSLERVLILKPLWVFPLFLFLAMGGFSLETIPIGMRQLFVIQYFLSIALTFILTAEIFNPYWKTRRIMS